MVNSKERLEKTKERKEQSDAREDRIKKLKATPSRETQHQTSKIPRKSKKQQNY